MSLPWSAQQLEWLREMGFDVLARRDDAAAALADRAGIPPPPATPAHAAAADAMRPPRPVGAGDDGTRAMRALQRVARGVDLAPLLAAGMPRDVASRRAFWRALRPLRRATRAP